MALSVLIVDDVQDFAETLAQLLEMQGYVVRKALTPIEAAIVAEEVGPDVILMDIGLRNLDGYGLAKKLCDRLLTRPLLIAITGYTGLEHRSEREGFNHHFVKPLELTELLKVLAAHEDKLNRG